MSPRLGTTLVLVLSSCAGAPVAPTPPLELSCGQVAEQLEKDSGLSDTGKRELVEESKARPLTWRVRVLSVSEQTSAQDFDHAMIMDAECPDRSSENRLGVRYFLTVYFSSKHHDRLIRLSKGDQVTVTGRLNRYEGGNAFSVKGEGFER